MAPFLPARRVNKDELRQIFNDGRYLERSETGEFRTKLHAEGHPASPRVGLPLCTRSQTIAYLDNQLNEVVLVHQYVLPNGNRSGRPDPKRLLLEGVIYYV